MTSQATELWGPETRKAVANFPVSGEPVPAAVVHWLGYIKAAAARTNASLGLLEESLAARIEEAALRVAAGEFDDQFPIDVFQTGSGTSSHMNANEVIASLAGAPVHPNDHVNMCQSSNDVFPTAVHLAAAEAIVSTLRPALVDLAAALRAKAAEFSEVAKAGRTHLMDAVPVTLGQEFAGYATMVDKGIARADASLERLREVPLGGSATGSGLNVDHRFPVLVRQELERLTGQPVSMPADFFEATAARDGLVEASAALRGVAVSLFKIANDVRLLGSGPRTGIGELVLPDLQKGSSFMPGKVNPVIPEMVTQVAVQVVGNDAAVAMAGSQGQFELNAFVPVMARNLLESIRLLAAAASVFAEKCVRGLSANVERCRQTAESTLASATALNPYIGYDLATAVVRTASSSGQTLRDAARVHNVPEEIIELALDPLALARGGMISRGDV